MVATRRADRRHPDKPDDNRNPFQRDRDRLIYSSAYRRLAGVTQVVSALNSHVYHNRLTHTIKVAQVAGRLAEKLAREHGEYAAREGIEPPDLNADVTEAAAIAHDLGHPPFGHVGEVELQHLMEPIDADDSFEGNAQTFRIVAKVARCQEGFVGLNLTRATLRAILKYPWLRDPAHPFGSVKWGAYAPDLDDFRFAKSLADDADLPEVYEAQSLEASVMDWADDITYAVHDIEDLFRAGMIPLDRFQASDSMREEFAEWVADRWRRLGKEASYDDILRVLRVFPIFFGTSDPYDGTSRQRARLRTFTSTLIGRYVGATTLRPPADEDSGWKLHVQPSAWMEVAVLKELTWRYVLETPTLASQRHGHKAVIRGLFEVFMDAAEATKTATATTLLPARVREDLEAINYTGVSTEAVRARIVCDAICTMTDHEAWRLYARLSGYSLGTLFEPI